MTQGFAAVTVDAFLGGKLHITQPKHGYRAATDPVFLAAATKASPGQTVLELGCGVGTAALCLLSRVAGLTVTGVELQAEYADLARQNARINGLPLDVMVADVLAPPETLKAMTFDHVILNPPYFEAEAVTPPGNTGKDIAHREGVAGLHGFVDAGLKRLKQKGWITIIHRTERLGDILSTLNGRAADIAILPLSSRAGRPARRVIVRARKGSAGPLILFPPMIVHREAIHQVDGSDFSDTAEAVLRRGEALNF